MRDENTNSIKVGDRVRATRIDATAGARDFMCALSGVVVAVHRRWIEVEYAVFHVGCYRVRGDCVEVVRAVDGRRLVTWREAAARAGATQGQTEAGSVAAIRPWSQGAGKKEVA